MLRAINGKPDRNLSNGANGYGLNLKSGEHFRFSESVACLTQLSAGVVDLPFFKERAQMLSLSIVFGFRFGRNGQK